MKQFRNLLFVFAGLLFFVFSATAQNFIPVQDFSQIEGKWNCVLKITHNQHNKKTVMTCDGTLTIKPSEKKYGYYVENFKEKSVGFNFTKDDGSAFTNEEIQKVKEMNFMVHNVSKDKTEINSYVPKLILQLKPGAQKYNFSRYSADRDLVDNKGNQLYFISEDGSALKIYSIYEDEGNLIFGTR